MRSVLLLVAIVSLVSCGQPEIPVRSYMFSDDVETVKDTIDLDGPRLPLDSLLSRFDLMDNQMTYWPIIFNYSNGSYDVYVQTGLEAMGCYAGRHFNISSDSTHYYYRQQDQENITNEMGRWFDQSYERMKRSDHLMNFICIIHPSRDEDSHDIREMINKVVQGYETQQSIRSDSLAFKVFLREPLPPPPPPPLVSETE